jgi:hypothetical protein
MRYTRPLAYFVRSRIVASLTWLLRLDPNSALVLDTHPVENSEVGEVLSTPAGL